MKQTTSWIYGITEVAVCVGFMIAAYHGKENQEIVFLLLMIVVALDQIKSGIAGLTFNITVEETEEVEEEAEELS